jgi:hypothetical protein
MTSVDSLQNNRLQGVTSQGNLSICPVVLRFGQGARLLPIVGTTADFQESGRPPQKICRSTR